MGHDAGIRLWVLDVRVVAQDCMQHRWDVSDEFGIPGTDSCYMDEVISKKRLPSGAGLRLASVFLRGVFGGFLPRLQRVEDV
jgi:hypothetical protein